MDGHEIKRLFIERLEQDGPTLIPNDQILLRRIVRELADQGKVFLDDSGKMDRVSLPVELEEGDTCLFQNCRGIVEITQEPCYCDVTNAPCSACENSHLACEDCGFDGHVSDNVKRWDKMRAEVSKQARFGHLMGSW